MNGYAKQISPRNHKDLQFGQELYLVRVANGVTISVIEVQELRSSTMGIGGGGFVNYIDCFYELEDAIAKIRNHFTLK